MSSLFSNYDDDFTAASELLTLVEKKVQKKLKHAEKSYNIQVKNVKVTTMKEMIEFVKKYAYKIAKLFTQELH